MVALLRRNLAFVPPSSPVVLDRSHALAQGLVMCADLQSQVELVTETPLQVSAGTRPPVTPTPQGMGSNLSGTATLAPLYRSSHNCTTNGMTMMATTIGSLGTTWVIGKPFAATHTTPFADYLYWGSQVRIGASTATITPPTTTVVTFIWVVNSNGTSTYWWNKDAIGTAFNAAAGITNTNSQAIRIGSRAGGGEQFLGTVINARVWDRPLSIPEVRQLQTEPYAMFLQPSAPRTHFVMSPRSPFRGWGIQLAA